MCVMLNGGWGSFSLCICCSHTIYSRRYFSWFSIPSPFEKKQLTVYGNCRFVASLQFCLFIFFICLFAICIFSLVNYLFISFAYFVILLLIFFFLNFKHCLCILDTSCLLDMWCASILSKSLKSTFAEQVF